jgi:hypothetical protein
MLRGTVIAFLAGWLIWFWIDKNPYILGPLPAPQEGELTANLQVAVDLLRNGRIKAAFVYAWKAHYLVLSLAAGLLLAMGGAALSRVWSRRRLSRLYAPRRRGADADKAERADSKGRETESE